MAWCLSSNYHSEGLRRTLNLDFSYAKKKTQKVRFHKGDKTKNGENLHYIKKMVKR